MGLSKVRFCVDLALVITTSFIIISYVFRSWDNQCQMTFMMEPPKFIPVPVDEISGDFALDREEKNKRSSGYKLFMYSEFGFPLTSDVGRDLKDSMPVLFVPGNAGSYQQVRSLASTCIRCQLQSLDAYKFIFYTIDFRGQLSGISGELIEDQISFVHKALNQISRMHPSETNGIILIGHSVGGFITKALFTIPGFEPSSVPLLINLASPLTKSYLNFDDKMRELYLKTSNYWHRNMGAYETLSISISGGKSDRLVPMHLSLDNDYDLSLTTSSIKDVWLTTDHVCITWCRELMHKLAHLLSALMDKKHTRLISNKNVTLSIIMKELLTEIESYDGYNPRVIQRDLRITKSHIIETFQDFYSATRNQLREETIILNLTGRVHADLLVWSEHINSLKENGIYGCKNLNYSSDNKHHTFCIDKIDLISLSRTIPSRKFEPKKTIITIPSNVLILNYIVLDFSSNVKEYHSSNKIPESISVQGAQLSDEYTFYVPTMLEFILKKMFSLESFRNEIIYQGKYPITLIRYKLIGLKYATQFFTAKLESLNCPSNSQPSEATVLFLQGEYLRESFHPDKDSQSVTIKLSAYQSIITKHGTKINTSTHRLEFYIDGTCDNYIHLNLDLWGLIENTIQTNLGKILTCSSYLAYASAISHTLELESSKKGSQSLLEESIHLILWALGCLMFYLIPSIEWQQYTSFTFDISPDEFTQFMLVFALSNGVLAFFGYIFKRIVDLATIMNNLQSFIRDKVNHSRARSGEINSGTVNGSTNNSKSETRINGKRKALNADGDWLLITFALGGSFILSEALMSLCMLLIIIKLVVTLNAAHYRIMKNLEKSCCKDFGDADRIYLFKSIFDLLVRVATLCTLALLSNIPAALLRISSNNKFGLFDMMVGGRPVGINFLASGVSLFLIKFICARIDSKALDDCSSKETNSFGFSPIRFLAYAPTKHLHLITLTPIAFIETNMCHINLVQLASLVWMDSRLFKMKTLKTEKKTSR